MLYCLAFRYRSTMKNFGFTEYSVGICGLIYLITAYGMFANSKYGLAITYVAYALANIGLIIASLEIIN